MTARLKFARLVLFVLVLALAITVGWGRRSSSVLAAGGPPQVVLDADSTRPREIEDLTEQRIIRDYALAWSTLGAALEQNRADLLDSYFVGFARNQFTRLIADQKKTGIHTRYLDRGHRLQAFFYAPDGGAMQLRDQAQLEVQVLDGTRIIYDQPRTLHYMVIMTPGADRWQVRLLQSVPGF